MKIICLISDTFRYDHLGCGGKKEIRTPELDQFAEDSTFFEHYYLSGFPTIPAREDFFTGRFSCPFHGWQPLKAEEIVLPEVLSGCGYINQLICDTPHLLSGDANYHRGFHAYHWIRGQEGDIYLTRFNHPIKEVMPDDKTREPSRVFGHKLIDVHRWQNWNWQGEEDTFIARTAQTACQWIENNYKLNNFFLWVDTFDPHEPWDPPEELVQLYDPGYKDTPMLHPNYGPASAYTKAELKNLRAHYAGEVTLVSRWLGKILKKLKEVGIYDDALIIFTTDHGIYLGEHNRTGKSNICKSDDRGPWPLYEEITHIPLMIRLPGGEGKGRVRELVQQVDLMPTILDAANIKHKPPMHGKPLLPLIKGGDESWDRPYAFSIYAPSAGESLGGINWSTVRDKEWAYLVGGREGDKEELYCLARDPGQENNVAGKNKGVALRMRRAYLGFLRSLGAEEEGVRKIEEKK